MYDNMADLDNRRRFDEFGRIVIDAKQNKSLKQQSMDTFAVRGSCECCGEDSTTALCSACQKDPLAALTLLHTRLKDLGSENQRLEMVCDGCAGEKQPGALFAVGQAIGPNCCTAVDCPVLYRRCRTLLNIEDVVYALDESCHVSW
jgi:hypothetical protein